jgi:hypothetical protein
MSGKLWVAVVLCGLARAEGPVSTGFRIGVPLQDFVESRNDAGIRVGIDRTPVIFGPTFMVNLPLGFGIQADGIFRRYELNATTAAGGTFRTQNFWIADTPLMARWQYNRWPVTPFVNGGVAWRTFLNLEGTLSDITNISVRLDHTRGTVLGGGVRFKLGPLKIAPEIRWWRFDENYLGPVVSTVFRPNRDQTDFLVGFYF